jgi:hypothetical protein
MPCKGPKGMCEPFLKYWTQGRTPNETWHIMHKNKILITDNTKYEIICPSIKIPLLALDLWHLLETKLNQTEGSYAECTKSQQTDWGWLSASSETGNMPGLYFSVYTARMVAVSFEIQMFTDLAECMISHTPYKHAIPPPLTYVWSHISMPSCLHPHIASILVFCVTTDLISL